MRRRVPALMGGVVVAACDGRRPPALRGDHAVIREFPYPGFDHGVGHPLLLLYNAKAPNCRKNKAFNGLGHYSEWPKVADAVIKAPVSLASPSPALA